MDVKQEHAGLGLPWSHVTNERHMWTCFICLLHTRPVGMETTRVDLLWPVTTQSQTSSVFIFSRFLHEDVKGDCFTNTCAQTLVDGPTVEQAV